MSYDVWLEIDTGGPEAATVADCGNMTSNVAPAWRAVGADVAEFHGKEAADCFPLVEEGLRRLRAAPGEYAHLVRGDGSWGTVASAVEYLERLAQDFRAHPLGTVAVSR